GHGVQVDVVFEVRFDEFTNATERGGGQSTARRLNHKQSLELGQQRGTWAHQELGVDWADVGTQRQYRRRHYCAPQSTAVSVLQPYHGVRSSTSALKQRRAACKQCPQTQPAVETLLG